MRALTPLELAVETTRGRDLEPLHAASERELVIGFDEEVDMRALEAEVDDPEVVAPRGGVERVAERVVGARAAEVPDGGHDTHDDVHGLARREPRASLVAFARTQPAGRPAGAVALAAAALAVLVELRQRELDVAPGSARHARVVARPTPRVN